MRTRRRGGLNRDRIIVECADGLTVEARADFAPARFRLRFSNGRASEEYATRDEMLRALDELVPGWADCHDGWGGRPKLTPDEWEQARLAWMAAHIRRGGGVESGEKAFAHFRSGRGVEHPEQFGRQCLGR